MSFTVINAPQRSPEWFSARAGLLTGSRACDAFARGRGTAESVSRRDYRIQLAAERLTDMPQEDNYVSREMQRGIDMEASAIAAYEALTGRIVRRTGFLRCKECMAGVSLDGDVSGFKRIVEVKCPKSATHIRYLREGVLPADYLDQCRHGLWITGAETVDFVSHDDRLPSPLQTFIVSIHRDQLDIPGYAIQALAFLKEVDAEVESLQKLMKRPMKAAA